ncbi:hypothetical protein HMPREF3191_00030 [Veillonellaceae bacterium DNF00626]|nr:hypothetical protein HMPREF3191_00030 [Veillonellaceae bacterium DNF00626]
MLSFYIHHYHSQNIFLLNTNIYFLFHTFLYIYIIFMFIV